MLNVKPMPHVHLRKHYRYECEGQVLLAVIIVIHFTKSVFSLGVLLCGNVKRFMQGRESY